MSAFITCPSDARGAVDSPDMVQPPATLPGTTAQPGLTFDEAQSQFVLWAVMKAPLMLGAHRSHPLMLGALGMINGAAVSPPIDTATMNATLRAKEAGTRPKLTVAQDAGAAVAGEYTACTDACSQSPVPAIRKGVVVHAPNHLCLQSGVVIHAPTVLVRPPSRLAARRPQ